MCKRQLDRDQYTGTYDVKYTEGEVQEINVYIDNSLHSLTIHGEHVQAFIIGVVRKKPGLRVRVSISRAREFRYAALNRTAFANWLGNKIDGACKF